MLSNRPYLLRAFYQWIVDSACTPILVVDATYPRCQIPKNYAEGDEIVFNVSPHSIRDFSISNEKLEFKASFSSIVHFISVPVQSIIAIYADENGEGLYFDGEDEGINESGSGDGHFISIRDKEVPTGMEQSVSKGKPFLKLVE